MDQHYRENIKKLGYNTMNKPNILKSDVKTLHLYANNAKPHNIIFFDNNKFMQHVKHVLYNNYHIPTILIDTKRTIETALKIGDFEINEKITGLLYFDSRFIVDPNQIFNDYNENFYENMVIIEL